MTKTPPVGEVFLRVTVLLSAVHPVLRQDERARQPVVDQVVDEVVDHQQADERERQCPEDGASLDGGQGCGAAQAQQDQRDAADGGNQHDLEPGRRMVAGRHEVRQRMDAGIQRGDVVGGNQHGGNHQQRQPDHGPRHVAEQGKQAAGDVAVDRCADGAALVEVEIDGAAAHDGNPDAAQTTIND